MLSQQQLCKCPAPGSWLGLRVLPEGRGGVAFPGSEGQEASEAACLLSRRRGTPSVGPDCASSGCLPPSRGRKPLKGVTDSWGSPDSGLWAGGGHLVVQKESRAAPSRCGWRLWVLCVFRASEQPLEWGGAETGGAPQGTWGPSLALHPSSAQACAHRARGEGRGQEGGMRGLWGGGSLGRQPGGFGLAEGPGEMELPSALELGLPGHQGVGLVGVGLVRAGLGAFWGGPGEGLELTLQPPRLCHTTQGSLPPQT